MEEKLPGDPPSKPPKFTHRRLPIPHDLWAQVLKLSEERGIAYQDLVVRLLDDGLKVRAWESTKFPGQKPLPSWEPPPRPTVKTMITVHGDLVAELELVQVPDEGETVMWEGRPYTVEERAWSIGKLSAIAYLRVIPWVKAGSGSRAP